MTKHILQSYGYDKLGHVVPLSGNDIARQIKSESLAWVHLDNSHEDTKKWLSKELSYLDAVIIDALTEESTRPRVEQIGQGLLLILRGANLNENADPEDMISLRIWVDSARMITLQRRPLKAVADFETKLKKGQVENNAGMFLAILIHLITQRMEPALAVIDEILDEVEEQVLEHARSDLSEKIVSIRKKSILFKRYLTPQKEALFEMLESDLEILNDKSHRIISESYNKTERYIEGLDAVRERAQVVREELSNTLTEKLNRNMYILSVITGVFLPLGFLTGLLGVNVGGIPGADNPQAFLYFCGILLILVLLQILTFVKLKWF